MRDRGAKLAALTGLIAVVLLVLSVIVAGEPPDIDDDPQEIVSFYLDEDDQVIGGSILAAYGALFLIFFAGALRSALRSRETGTGGASAVAFAGLLIMAVGILLFAGIGFTLGDAADDLDVSAILALNALSIDLFLPLAGGTAAFLLGSGVAAVRTGALPKWLGIVAIVLGVLAVTPIGFFAFLAALVWILVVSVMLALRPAAEGPSRPGGTTPAAGPPT